MRAEACEREGLEAAVARVPDKCEESNDGDHSGWTNQTQEARVYSHDGPIRCRKARVYSHDGDHSGWQRGRGVGPDGGNNGEAVWGNTEAVERLAAIERERDTDPMSALPQVGPSVAIGLVQVWVRRRKAEE
eukprot:825228-Prorocentrum_minimum.AAC.1